MKLFENYNIGHHDAVTFGCAVMIAVVGYLLIKKKRVNTPPGPFGLPLFGYAPFLGKNPGETMMRLKKRYGPVMSMKLGTRTWIILNDLSTITEVFVSKSDASSSRLTSPVMHIMTENGHGIFAAQYGPTFKTLRKFGLINLRGIGSGPKSVESLIMEEVPFLLENLTRKSKDPLRRKLMLAVGNTMNSLLLGTRSCYDDKGYRALLDMVANMILETSLATRAFAHFTCSFLPHPNPGTTRKLSDTFNTKLLGLIHLVPAFRHLPVFSGALRSLEKDVKLGTEILRKSIADHKEKYNENDISDFIDAFLEKMDETEEKQLTHFVRDMYQGGVGTTASSLMWIILAFATYPEMQERIFQEVSAASVLKNRAQMPYTRAFIQEIMRHRTLGPIGVPHKTDRDIDVCGYRIPKNSAVISNLWAINHDPQTFKNPDEFTPDRFIDDQGQFVSSPQVVAFGVGPRQCTGQYLAREGVFLFTASIVQKLRVVLDPANPLPAFSDGRYNLFTYESEDFEVNFEVR